MIHYYSDATLSYHISEEEIQEASLTFFLKHDIIYALAQGFPNSTSAQPICSAAEGATTHLLFQRQASVGLWKHLEVTFWLLLEACRDLGLHPMAFGNLQFGRGQSWKPFLLTQ